MKRKKKKYKSAITKRIFRSIKKIEIILLVLIFSGCFQLMKSTNAGFLDEEISEGNQINAGTLDFALASENDFSPDITPSQTASRAATLANIGIFDFQYKVAAKNLSGDLCDYLEIKDDLTGAYQPLAGYASALTDNAIKTDWIFTVQLIGNDHSLENETCDFDLEFTGWQTDFADDTNGWSDQEIITSQIQSGEWINPGEVVINEIMWMGSTVDYHDEWIELKNTTEHSIDIGQWEIENAKHTGNNKIQIPANKLIPAHGFFLIGNYPKTSANSALNVDVDEVNNSISLLDSGNGNLILRDGNNNIIDQAKGDNWPKGINSGGFKKSMERHDDPGNGLLASSWHTCVSDLCNDGTYWDAADGNNYGTPGAPNLSPVVMNEIMFNPAGGDKEWVELYNLLEKDYDAAGWYFINGGGDKIVISKDNSGGGKTKISGKGYLIIYLGKDFLDDQSDTLSFYNDMGTPDDESDDAREDVFQYKDAVKNEGDSFMRIPDGTGVWIDPSATPGKENKLNKEEKAGFQLLAYDKCFDGKKLKKNTNEEICAPAFLQYLKMIKELDDKKIREGTLSDILEMKEEMEKKKIKKILEETEDMLGEQIIPVIPAPASGEAPAAADDPVEIKPEISPSETEEETGPEVDQTDKEAGTEENGDTNTDDKDKPNQELTNFES